MQRLWGLSLAGLVALGAGCESMPPPRSTPVGGGVDAAQPQLPRPSNAPATFVLADSRAGLDRASLGKLKISAVRDLWVRVIVPEPSGITAVTASFLPPSGEVFFEQRFAFSQDPKVNRIRAVAGHEVDVQHAHVVGTGHALDVMIPIAGSTFDRYAVAGAWTVRAVVERVGAEPLMLSRQLEVDVTR